MNKHQYNPIAVFDTVAAVAVTLWMGAWYFFAIFVVVSIPLIGIIEWLDG